MSLIQPDEQPRASGANTSTRMAKVRHHLALRVPDTEAAVAFLAGFGIPVVQQGLYADASGRYTYLGSEAALVPEPPKQSRTRSPGRLELRMQRSTSSTGFIVGCRSLRCGLAICHTSP